MTLAEKILSLRARCGLSQDALAERLGVSRQSVSKWETAQSTPDLDKLIRLADLFGVSLDELVREETQPHPPEPSKPRGICVNQTRELTGTQKTGIVLAAVGVVLAIMGMMGTGLLILFGPALMLLSLPLILAKKHPWLIAGWLVVALSLAVLSPYTSVAPWGLLGGLWYLRAVLANPEMRHLTYVFAAATGILRGLFTLALLFLTWRAWKRRQ